MANLNDLKALFQLTDEELTLFNQAIRTTNSTVVELAKATHIPRTQIYRLSESLADKGLFKKIVDQKRIKWQAESPSQIELLVKDKVAHFTKLQDALPDILNSLQISPHQSNTEVRFYHGETGISQLVWHILEAKDEIVGYTYRDFAAVVGQSFAEDFYLEIIKKQIHIRDIISDEYVSSVGGWDQAKQSSFPHPDWPKRCQSRYLPDDKLPICHQLDIYNDTVAFYNWHQGEIFGVEIINAKVAAFQRSLFNLVWNQAKPY